MLSIENFAEECLDAVLKRYEAIEARSMATKAVRYREKVKGYQDRSRRKRHSNGTFRRK